MFGRTSQRDEQRAIEYRDWFVQRNRLAIVALVLGAFSVLDLGVLIVPEIAGIVVGIISLRQLRRPNAAQPHGHRLAIAGIVLSVLSLIIAACMYFSPHPVVK